VLSKYGAEPQAAPVTQGVPVSSGTAAQPPDTAAPPQAETPPQGAAPERSPRDAGPDRPQRPGRGWALLIAAASVLFCVALVLGAMRLYPDVGEVTDTPERTVDAFLESLLGRHDAAAAAEWLCADKADRDLGEAVTRISLGDGPGALEWGAVTETDRSVGAATVSAEIRLAEGGASSAPTTWVFSLVAEEGEPQWLICGIAAA
jgi:hypothetical protein